MVVPELVSQDMVKSAIIVGSFVKSDEKNFERNFLMLVWTQMRHKNWNCYDMNWKLSLGNQTLSGQLIKKSTRTSWHFNFFQSFNHESVFIIPSGAHFASELQRFSIWKILKSI